MDKKYCLFIVQINKNMYYSKFFVLEHRSSSSRTDRKIIITDSLDNYSSQLVLF